MRIPQEIADAIIDSFARRDDEKISLISRRHWREPDDANALRACSLASRSFLRRSRMHLFSAFICEHLSEFSHFDHLLAESPHIGELYVIYFTLEIGNHITPLLTEDVVLPRILSRLPRLTHFSLNFLSRRYIHLWGSQPPLFKAGIRATLSLQCLRNLCLYYLDFANASELELLLSHATGLKTLTLGNIHFENPSVRRVDVPHEVRVVLESFELELETDVVDAMLSGFSIVDIKHLKSLIIHSSSPITPLLRANAQTIQKVRITSSYHVRASEPPDPDILKGNQTLHLIEITEHRFWMASALRKFGHLGHLKALKTMFLDFTDSWGVGSPNAADWTELDAILSQAVNGLEDIHIHTEQMRDAGLVRSLLPSVGGEIAVHVHQQLPSGASEGL
ncbi:hypothetical protein C8J57DRAFT_376655 [Mycena rebaudengoi]|nr:hypothetical protein C8J57DRAFT_376655 [Mycena rebaudengoi]